MNQDNLNTSAEIQDLLSEAVNLANARRNRALNLPAETEDLCDREGENIVGGFGLPFKPTVMGGIGVQPTRDPIIARPKYPTIMGGIRVQPDPKPMINGMIAPSYL